MTALKVVGVLFLLLFLLGLIRLGGTAEYGTQGIQVCVRVGLLKFQVVPGKKKKEPKPEAKKPESGGKPKEKAKEPAKEKLGDPLHLLKLYVPLACEAAGELRRRIRIDRLNLDFISAGEAASAAMTFGYVNVALGMLWPLIDNNFEVKNHRIRTAVDFDAQSPTIYVNAAFSARISQLVSFAVRFGIKFLKRYLRDEREQKAQAENITKEANS